ncbi:hypothetical protein NM208_g6768 [Fusarium decemcellulare]|uniref:Uncharacterized protein n=1 Tax=Fusarium decemcellulare TaxID=57161 RepID=A0ACC1SBQ9_9HYPO|nr:hypothetical protein NM208_g6768 [Fusarium decemcellulare]
MAVWELKSEGWQLRKRIRLGKLKIAVAAFQVAFGFDSKTTHGPLVTTAGAERADALVQDALEAGDSRRLWLHRRKPCSVVYVYWSPLRSCGLTQLSSCCDSGSKGTSLLKYGKGSGRVATLPCADIAFKRLHLRLSHSRDAHRGKRISSKRQITFPAVAFDGNKSSSPPTPPKALGTADRPVYVEASNTTGHRKATKNSQRHGEMVYASDGND